jgi:hypothetical protein
MQMLRSCMSRLCEVVGLELNRSYSGSPALQLKLITFYGDDMDNQHMHADIGLPCSLLGCNDVELATCWSICRVCAMTPTMSEFGTMSV